MSTGPNPHCFSDWVDAKNSRKAILFHILYLIPYIDEPINFPQADEVQYYTHR